MTKKESYLSWKRKLSKLTPIEESKELRYKVYQYEKYLIWVSYGLIQFGYKINAELMNPNQLHVRLKSRTEVFVSHRDDGPATFLIARLEYKLDGKKLSEQAFSLHLKKESLKEKLDKL